MIPTRTSRPFGRISPRVSSADLARLIDRTIKLRVDAKREQGFAAVNVGCDGRKRTTMFDGSACQVEGEVCIATRQDGISACIEAPTQGNGLTTRLVTFSAPVCEPVTGWYILDDESYLYKIPSALVTAVAYYPEAGTPTGTRYDLVRSGTWDDLMCAAALTPPVDNGEGGCLWQTFSLDGETIESTIQYFYARLGGCLTHLITVPSATAAAANVTVSAFSGRWRGSFAQKLTDTVVPMSSSDFAGNTLLAGQEYKAILYGTGYGGAATVSTLKGVRATAGSAVLPTLSSAVQIALAEVTVPYSAVVSATAVGTTVPKNWDDVRELTADQEGNKWAFTGILLRDVDDPNPGVRELDVTLPAAGTGVATGTVHVGFGYPFAFEHLNEEMDSGPPYGFSGDETPGPYSGHTDYDMALVYGPPRLAVEYAPYHLNVAGASIENPEDWTALSTEVASDITANIIQLPSSEIALSRAITDGGTPVVPQMFDRYRIRPAPDTAPSVALAQTTVSVYGVDPNNWVSYLVMGLVAWTPGDVTVTKSSGTWGHGHDLPVVIWQNKTGQAHWSLDPTAKTGTVGEPSGSVVPIAFDVPGGCQALTVGATQRLSYLGPRLVVQYGWTFTVDGDESALSPLSEVYEVPTTAVATYDLTVTIPVGPSGTTERTIYRFAYDREILRYNPTATTARWRRPWSDVSERAGGVYDRMCSRVVMIPDNSTTTWIDNQTTIAFSGARPPSPFVGPVGAGITLDTTRRVYALPPLNL